MSVSTDLSWTLGAPGILQLSNKGRFSSVLGFFAELIKKEEVTSALEMCKSWRNLIDSHSLNCLERESSRFRTGLVRY